MSTKRPDLSDFGVTPEEYALYAERGRSGGPSCLVALLALVVVFSVASSIALVITRDWSVALWSGVIAIFLGSGLTVFGAATLIESAIVRFKRFRLLKSPVASQIKLYEEAEAAFRMAQEKTNRERWKTERARREAESAQREAERRMRRKLCEHWMSLSGVEFERELGTLYRNMGYQVELTPRSGDQGIDLVLRKNGKTTVVQCKSHKAPVGPAVVRELFGSMVASGADNAILACTGGFTRGVREFVRGKPIALVSAPDLAKLSGSIEYKTQDGVASALVCPMPGCGKTMVLWTGRYGEFWGCSRFPKCRGTRDV